MNHSQNIERTSSECRDHWVSVPRDGEHIQIRGIDCLLSNGAGKERVGIAGDHQRSPRDGWNCSHVENRAHHLG